MDERRDAATTEAVAATAQSRGESLALAADERGGFPGYGYAYRLGERVTRVPPAPPERGPEDPLYRPLRIYTLDPATPRLEGATALINVPYEPLEPGPVGRLFAVEDYDDTARIQYRRVDLDDKSVLMRSGLTPTPSDPRFHQQMVYAVCSIVYASFCKALGRQLGWGFQRQEDSQHLRIRPHAGQQANACYDEIRGELRFGYYKTDPNQAANAARTLPGSTVFTCLSHDIVAHEVTHALLDGLHRHFSQPSGPDMLAFHEAFADLIALFHHFSYREIVRAAIQRSRGDLEKAPFLTGLARQLGHALGKNAALRSGIDSADPAQEPRQLYDENLEAHELGAVLVAAIFEAFLVVYRRKTARYLRLATGGSGVLPAGELSADLQEILADRVSKLAGQFLSILIRAIDYCPPVDLRFGEYLRALISADYDLVPDDPWAYREALIDAFLRRNIYPRHVPHLSEDALLWCPTRKRCGLIKGLDFATLRFSGEPGTAASPDELRRQACVLGEFITRPDYLEEFGLVADGDPRLGGDTVEPPTVESIRSSRRVGPDGQIVFDLIAEVVQIRQVRSGPDGPGFRLYGGATVILGPRGEIRYVILKSVVREGAVERRREFLHSAAGRRYWVQEGRRLVPRQQFFGLLDGHPKT